MLKESPVWDNSEFQEIEYRKTPSWLKLLADDLDIDAVGKPAFNWTSYLVQYKDSKNKFKVYFNCYHDNKTKCQNAANKIKTKLKRFGCTDIEISSFRPYFDFSIDFSVPDNILDKYISEESSLKDAAKTEYETAIADYDIEKYRPDEKTIQKLIARRDAGKRTNVKAIKDIDKLITYYYAAKLIDDSNLADDIRNTVNWSNKGLRSLLNAIDYSVKPENLDSRSHFEVDLNIPKSNLFTFEDQKHKPWLPRKLYMYFIENNIPVYFGKRTPGGSYDHNGLQWSEIEHLKIFYGQPEEFDFDIVVHTLESGGATTYTSHGTSERVPFSQVLDDLDRRVQKVLSSTKNDSELIESINNPENTEFIDKIAKYFKKQYGDDKVVAYYDGGPESHILRDYVLRVRDVRKTAKDSIKSDLLRLGATNIIAKAYYSYTDRYDLRNTDYYTCEFAFNENTKFSDYLANGDNQSEITISIDSDIQDAIDKTINKMYYDYTIFSYALMSKYNSYLKNRIKKDGTITFEGLDDANSPFMGKSEKELRNILANNIKKCARLSGPHGSSTQNKLKWHRDNNDICDEFKLPYSELYKAYDKIKGVSGKVYGSVENEVDVEESIIKESFNEEEISFEQIVRMMEQASDYDDLYDAANLIVDPEIREDVIDMITSCQMDGDDIETCYSVTTSEYIDPHLDNPNVFKESIQLNEGPGAGYTIKAKVSFDEVEDVKILDVAEYEEDDCYAVKFSCKAYGVADEIEALSYYYDPTEIDEPVYCEMTEGEADLYLAGDNKDVMIDAIKTLIRDCVLNIDHIHGSGYSHTTYDGTLSEMDHSDIADCYNSNYDDDEITGANIKIKDTNAIDYIDRGVRGENAVEYYTVEDDDTGAEESFDTLEDALTFAREHNDTQVRHFVDIHAYNGEILTDHVETIGVDLDESYGGAFDIDENQYFTREEIEEFAESVKDEVEKTAINAPLKVTDVYTIHNGFGGDFLTMFIEDFEGNEYDYDVRIDMRKIKKPSDLYKYKDEFVNHFYNQFCLEEAELDESLDEVDDYGPYYVKVFNYGADMNTLGFDNESEACRWAKEQVRSGYDDEAAVYKTETDECLYVYDNENVNESVELNEDSDKAWGQRAYNLNEIISSMNNEEAYYGGWLYIWPDGTDLDDAYFYFGSKEAYEDLETSFKKYYRAYHKDGLYTDSKRIEDMAHSWDEKLGLPPIKNYYKELN